MSDVSATIDSLKALAGAGRPVQLEPSVLGNIAGYLEDASAVAAGQDAAEVAATRALSYRAEGRKMREEAAAAQWRAAGMLARARQLRRHQWALLAAQVLVLAIWGVMIWGWG